MESDFFYCVYVVLFLFVCVRFYDFYFMGYGGVFRVEYEGFFVFVNVYLNIVFYVVNDGF